MSLPPLRAHYRLTPVPGEASSPGAGRGRAEAIAREQTLEVPPGAAPPEIEAAFLGRVAGVEPDPQGARGATRVVVEYAPALFDGSLTQLLNVVWGNVSLMDGVLLTDLELPEWVLQSFGGPRFGIPGIRRLVGNVQGRPLVSSALKPVGLGVGAVSYTHLTLPTKRIV